MGIDIYARWRKMSNEDEKKQYTGFSTWSGNVGYLREAYHGDPYATQLLVKEAFDSEDGEAKISYKVMEKRLPEALKAVIERYTKLYPNADGLDIYKSMKSYVDFVKLCKRKEIELGEEVLIIASY